MPIRTEVTKAQALRALATTQMRDFSEADWSGFAGCESKDPMIGCCEINGAHHVLVLDGDEFLVQEIGDISGGLTFRIEEDT